MSQQKTEIELDIKNLKKIVDNQTLVEKIKELKENYDDDDIEIENDHITFKKSVAYELFLGRLPIKIAAKTNELLQKMKQNNASITVALY